MRINGSAALLGTMLVGAVVFFSLKLSRPAVPEPEETLSATRDPALFAKTEAGKAIRIRAHSARTATRSPVTVAPERIRGVERALISLRFDDSEKNFLDAAEANKYEGLLKKAILGAHHAEELPEGAGLFAHYMDELKQSPEEAMEAMRSVMDKIPSTGFVAERASLLDFATDLPGEESQAHELALQEMNRPVSEDPAEASRQMALVTIAHSIALRTSDSPEQSLKDTVKAIQTLTDPQERKTLAIQLTDQYPQFQSEVTLALRRVE